MTVGVERLRCVSSEWGGDRVVSKRDKGPEELPMTRTYFTVSEEKD